MGSVRAKPDPYGKKYEAKKPYLIYEVCATDKLTFKQKLHVEGSYNVAGGYGPVSGSSSGSAHHTAEVNMTSSDPIYGVIFGIDITRLYRIYACTPSNQLNFLIFYSAVGAPSSVSISREIKNKNAGNFASFVNGSSDFQQTGASDFSSRFVLFKYANPDLVKSLVDRTRKSDSPRMMKEVTVGEHLETQKRIILIFEDEELAKNTQFNQHNKSFLPEVCVFIPTTSSSVLSSGTLKKISPDWLPAIQGEILKAVPPTPVKYIDRSAKLDDVIKAGKEILSLKGYIVDTPYLWHLQAERVHLVNYGTPDDPPVPTVQPGSFHPVR